MNQRRVHTSDGISWHVQTAGTGKSWIVMIPSGEGDCQCFEAVAPLLASKGDFSVLTFDMPGFSRTVAPEEAYAKVTPQLVAKQIVTLLDELGIDRASIWGSSSGGGAALALAALYPDRVACIIIHEVPFGAPPPPLIQLLSQPDDELVAAGCKHMFANFFIEQEENNGRAKWEALGSDYHERLSKNFVTWVRRLCPYWIDDSVKLATTENLRKRPIFWTVGGLNPDPSIYKEDFEYAEIAGSPVSTKALMSLHFPQITIPEQLADYIVECVRKVQG